MIWYGMAWYMLERGAMCMYVCIFVDHIQREIENECEGDRVIERNSGKESERKDETSHIYFVKRRIKRMKIITSSTHSMKELKNDISFQPCSY